MLRSLYSAVSGMKAHQTKLDVIGNNIANVNTYGFKSSRARFQDVFYQTLQSAAGGDNNKGGTNASQVGYGSQLGGIDLDMSRSALQSTGRPMDVAITGEGFFQVMDADGNIFYTRAGNLMLDSNSGNLVDSNTPDPRIGILNGTSQREMFAWALEEGKKAEYRKLPIAELREADSLYMTHGGWSIPISAIDGRALAVDAAEIQAINDAIHSGRTHEDALKIGPTGDYE